MMDLNILCFALIGIVAAVIIGAWAICCFIEGAWVLIGGTVDWIKEKMEAKQAKKDWDKWFEEHPEFERNF